MIDREARLRAVDIIERINSERLSNWEIEDAWPKSKCDPALNCILRWIWTLWDDNHKIVFVDTLDRDGLRILERCKRFLNSDLEFPTATLSPEERNIVRKKWGKEWLAECTGPEDDAWPFPSTAK